jgi:ribose 5-phosphate isomerase B
LKSIFKNICIASDHAGYDFKNYIKEYLIRNDISVIDLGPNKKKSVDYPDYAKKVAVRIKKRKSDIGILVCGSGTGMAITSNKVKSVRAAQCYSKSSTVLARQHNNANIICLGSRMITRNEAFKFISLFLKTKFEGGRHQKRINKI